MNLQNLDIWKNYKSGISRPEKSQVKRKFVLLFFFWGGGGIVIIAITFLKIYFVLCKQKS